MRGIFSAPFEFSQDAIPNQGTGLTPSAVSHGTGLTPSAVKIVAGPTAAPTSKITAQSPNRILFKRINPPERSWG